MSGGGVAANSLGVPDLGISTMDDVLIDIRRITDACPLPLLVDADTGWGGAFNIARTVKSFIKFGAAGLHIEDQVQAKRCGHRPGKEVVSKQEMVDRVKAAVDARTDPNSSSWRAPMRWPWRASTRPSSAPSPASRRAPI
jgi:methylisocitrate lyase